MTIISNINTLTEIVEKHWSRSINKKVNTAKRLIEFKSTIKQKNIKLLETLTNTNISTYKRQSWIITEKKNIISYIGTWYINVQQRLITIHHVKQCLGDFIYSEYYLLQPFIAYYLSNRVNVHYSDAINCLYLFNKCAK